MRDRLLALGDQERPFTTQIGLDRNNLPFFPITDNINVTFCTNEGNATIVVQNLEELDPQVTNLTPGDTFAINKDYSITLQQVSPNCSMFIIHSKEPIKHFRGDALQERLSPTKVAL